MHHQHKRKPIVGVMGSAQPGPHETMAYELGRELARANYVLLNGGGPGIMQAVSQGMAEAGGLVVGVLPSDGPQDPHFAHHYPNPYVHIPIYTGMLNARNVINVRSSDVVVALPGGAGTLSEVALALNSGTPVILLNWPELVLPASCPQHLISRADDVATALQMIAEVLS